VRLQQLVQKGNRFEVQYHNEFVEFLNHTNERRVRAAKAFYEDSVRFGLGRARLNAKRPGRRNRLRVMNGDDM